MNWVAPKVRHGWYPLAATSQIMNACLLYTWLSGRRIVQCNHALPCGVSSKESQPIQDVACTKLCDSLSELSFLLVAEAGEGGEDLVGGVGEGEQQVFVLASIHHALQEGIDRHFFGPKLSADKNHWA